MSNQENADSDFFPARRSRTPSVAGTGFTPGIPARSDEVGPEKEAVNALKSLSRLPSQDIIKGGAVWQCAMQGMAQSLRCPVCLGYVPGACYLPFNASFLNPFYLSTHQYILNS
jgi:hypothetical protein